MIDVGYQKINTPLLPAGVATPSHGIYSWESSAKVVVSFKRHLKEELRKLQKGRCCYCRRLLGDSISVHLEHFIEKSVVADVTFEVPNIAVACATCNTNKNGAFLRLVGLLSKRESRRQRRKVKIARCIALQGSYSARVMPANRTYRWVHPHFHFYSNHLSIHKGWIFIPKSREGARTIRGLKLNSIGEIERRAMQERLKSKKGFLSLLIAGLAEADREKSKTIVQDLIAIIKTRNG